MIQIALAAGVLLAQDPATPITYAVSISDTGDRPDCADRRRLRRRVLRGVARGGHVTGSITCRR